MAKVTVSRRVAVAMDSAAKVLAEGRATAALVSAVSESRACVPIKKSLLLQRFAVNLVNANKAADKIPILLIRERAIVRRPRQLPRRVRMIWIVH